MVDIRKMNPVRIDLPVTISPENFVKFVTKNHLESLCIQFNEYYYVRCVPNGICKKCDILYVLTIEMNMNVLPPKTFLRMNSVFTMSLIL